MITSIIIDDEQDGRDSLRRTLELYCSEIEILASCASANEGLAEIRKHQPDLVFLDIQMPQMTGFQLLERFDAIHFKVIFVTAFDKYAIKAIKYSALDYLVKPVDADELMLAIKRMKSLENLSVHDQYKVMFSNLKKPRFEKLAVPTMDRIHFLNIEDIIYCEAQNNYTLFYLKGGKKELSSKTLKEFDILLEDEGFYRIHHAALINLNCLVQYMRGEGGSVELIEGHHVNVSRRKKEEFLKRIL